MARAPVNLAIVDPNAGKAGDQSPLTAPAPVPATAPTARDAKGRYAKRKLKRLADLSPEVQECVSSKIGRLLEEGYDQDQAVAIAISMCTEVEGG